MERIINAWTERLRFEIPDAVAIVLKGSHARDTAGPHSDVDFDVLVFSAHIAHPYLTWIEDDGTGRLVHVSVAVRRLDEWLAEFREPADWSFGFPAVEATRLKWVGRGSMMAELHRSGRGHPAGEPELEDFIESLGKARNARLRGDELSVRLAVQDIAGLCPSLLVPFNPEAMPGTKPEALQAALALTVVPEGYHQDMMLCLGLSGRASTVDEMLEAGTRLVMNTLTMLEANADMICPHLAPNLPELLRAGVIRRYLEQGNSPQPGEGDSEL